MVRKFGSPERGEFVAIRVLVVDDNDFVRRSVVSVLDQVDGIDVVAECADGIEVAAVAERLRPDVVVMDVQMPIMTGIDAAWLLRRCTRGRPRLGQVHRGQAVW